MNFEPLSRPVEVDGLIARNFGNIKPAARKAGYKSFLVKSFKSFSNGLSRDLQDASHLFMHELSTGPQLAGQNHALDISIGYFVSACDRGHAALGGRLNQLPNRPPLEPRVVRSFLCLHRFSNSKRMQLFRQ